MMEYTRGYVMTYKKKCIGIKLMKRTCTQVNLMYICASLFTLVHLRGCSENCKPILARNNLEITDKHAAEF